MINAGRYRWSSRCCFITVAVVLTPVPVLAGRICRPDYRTEALYRSVPLVDVTVVPDDEIVQHRRVALLELIQKHIRQRDLMGLIDQLAVLLVTGCANDSQITALLNYILLAGDEASFKEFISELTSRIPHHRERIMTIAERIHNDGWLLGRERGGKKGKKKGNRASSDCCCRMGRILNGYKRLPDFRQSKCRH